MTRNVLAPRYWLKEPQAHTIAFERECAEDIYSPATITGDGFTATNHWPPSPPLSAYELAKLSIELDEALFGLVWPRVSKDLSDS